MWRLERHFPHFLDEESVTRREVNGLRVTKPGLELTSLDPQTVHFLSPQVDTRDGDCADGGADFHFGGCLALLATFCRFRKSEGVRLKKKMEKYSPIRASSLPHHHAHPFTCHMHTQRLASTGETPRPTALRSGKITAGPLGTWS